MTGHPGFTGLAVLVLAASSASARAADTSPTKLDKLFDQFCSDRPTSGGCGAKNRNQVLEWRILEDACTAVPESTDDAPCTAFRDLPPLMALSFDPTSRTWSPLCGRAGSRTGGCPRNLYSTDVHGIPRLNVSGQDVVSIVIEPANPLLDRVARGEIKETDIDQLADLQKLVAVAGIGLSAFARAQEMRARTFAQETSFAWEARRISDAAIKAKASLDLVTRTLDVLVRARRRLADLARAFERELRPQPVPPELQHSEANEDDEGRWVTLFAQLEDDRASLEVALARTPGELISAYRDVIEQAGNAQSVATSCELFLAANQTLPAAEKGSVRDELAADVGSIRDVANTTPGVLAARLQTSRTSFQEKVIGLQAFQKAGAVALKRIAEALGSRDEVLASAINLYELRERAATSIVGDALQAAVYVPDHPQGAAWDKVRTYPLTVSRGVSSGAGKLADVSTSYRLANRLSTLLGVGAGMTITPMSSPVFKAVKDGEGRQRIQQTGVDSRTGQIGLFANFKLVEALVPVFGRSWVQPGAEFGVAVSADNPAVFYGGSLEFFGILRIGYGQGHFRVKELDGQRVNDVVSAADDIRTRSAFASGRYWSLTVGLNSLHLFTNK